MKYLLALIFFIGFIHQPLFTQTDSLALRRKANQLMLYSTSVNAVTLGQTLFYSKNDFQARNFSPLYFVTNALQHAPNFAQSRSLELAGLQATTTAGFYATKNLSADNQIFNRILFVPSYNISLFASYTAYRDLRKKHPVAAADNWKSYKVNELLLAPYDKQTIKNPFVWGSAIGAIGLNLVTNSNSNSIFRTGKTYIGVKEYHPWVALPLMVGANLLVHSFVGASEEAHYRGMFFEQIQTNMSGAWASAFDVLYFILLLLIFRNIT